MSGLRIVVTGATGNVGSSVVEALSAEAAVGSVLGLSRRETDWSVPKVEFAVADVSKDNLHRHFEGADVVVNLAWLFQPTRRPEVTWENNVSGSSRVFQAVADTGVPALIHASSVGAYSPGRNQPAVSEQWPTDGWPGAAYPREKAYLERCLDIFEERNDTRVVRMRPGFIFQRRSASSQRRLFAGPFLPGSLVGKPWIPVLPRLPGLTIQVLHASDVAKAYAAASVGEQRGAFNLAADPPITMEEIAELLGARVVNVPQRMIRSGVGAAWRAHAIPATPGLFDTVTRVPTMDCSRARIDLGWIPEHSPSEVLREFFEGLRSGAGGPTAPLEPDRPASRLREIATGLGFRP
ncbi:NAD-dependent epimerase/dehydratase family protein [Rhodococcus erythropolis]|uniref:NAD-dependent epimerase/dehydratase family protein n=1 Tax=Rhodococcus erythropolis TaxID=1833 RepID=UPI001BEA6F2E|nr:NAD-dependent epimerase/dehydratase family protein [Rhodococcus erythropolis]MBT2264352.1 NAD-dependent epimerase/dehydratase family protein [Rhodococcus erythropolis]